VTEAPHVADPLAADRAGEHRAEPVPPVPHRLMTEVDVTLEQQVFDVLSDSGYFTYIITTRRITSGDELNSGTGWRACGEGA